MNKEYQIQEINPDEIKHADIDDFEFYENKKKFMVNLCHVGLKSGVFLYDCTITITDWWNVKTSFTEGGKEVDINMLQDFILKNPIDSAIYEYLINGDAIVFNGHVSDYLFSLEFIKPKIHITGEYDPD